MSATVTSQTARHSVSPALTLSSPCSSLGTISLTAIQSSSRPPTSLRNGTPMIWAMMMVKKMRSSTGGAGAEQDAPEALPAAAASGRPAR